MERSTESRARDDFADETTEARRACAAAADADGSPEEEHASLLQQDFEDYDSGGHLLGWGEAPLEFRSGASAGEMRSLRSARPWRRREGYMFTINRSS